MTIHELKEKLRDDLNIVEKFLEIARRNKLDLSTELSLSGGLSALHIRGANGSTESAPYGKIGPAVVTAIKQCKKNWDVRDIDRVLRKSGKTSISKLQIATALRRFEQQGKIKEVKHGSGRRPNRYTTISL